MSNGVSKNITLVVTATAQFLLPFMLAAINVALPSIGREFSLSAVMLGWVSTSFVLVAAALLIPFGRLADIYGRRKIFILGLVVHIIASLTCSLSTSITMLLAGRVLQGLSSAMVIGVTVAIITSVFPAEERGRAIGLNVAAVYLGLTSGPFLGGVLTEQLGWRSIFFVAAGLGLVALLLGLTKLKGEWADSRGEKYDLPGAVALVVSMELLMYGFATLPETSGFVLMALGLAGLVGFAWWEGRAPSPLMDVSLFRGNRIFVFSNLAALINYSAVTSTGFLLSLYLQYVQGYDPQITGLILIVASVMMVILAPLAGRLSDRVDPRKVAAVGMGFSCVPLVMMTFLTEGTAIWYIIIVNFITGIGVALFSSPNTTAIMGAVGRRFLGVASGTNATMRNTGMMFSMGVMMILFTLFMGDAQVTADNHPAFLVSMRTGFVIFAGLCFLGIFAQLAGGKPQPR